jgi:hypothetical protein
MGTQIKQGETADVLLKTKPRFLTIPYLPKVGFYPLAKTKVGAFSKKKFGFLIHYDGQAIELRSERKHGNTFSITVTEYGQLVINAACDMESVYLPALECKYVPT